MATQTVNLNTWSAKRIFGDNSSQNPDGALLQSGLDRSDNSTNGDTWIYIDSLAGDSSPYGIKHLQGDDKIATYGGITDNAPTSWLQLSSGNLYVYGKIGIGYDPNTANNSYKLYVTDGPTLLNGTTAASSTNLSGQLIVSNSSGSAVALELWRNGNASWQIANDAGVLYIRNNWTTTKQSTYSQNSLILDYNTGAASLPYLALGQTTRNTTYKLYVNGTSYFNGAVSVPSTLTVRAENTTNEGGQICLTADPNHSDYHAYLDVYDNYFRIYSNGAERFSINLSANGIVNAKGPLSVGVREVTSAPSSLTYSNRITIVPYFHTGGPWYIKSGDDATNAHLALYYGTSNLINIRHNAYTAIGDSVFFSNNTSWANGTMIIGSNGDKVIVGHENGTVAGAVVGAHSTACTAWAVLNISGSSINFRMSDTLVAKILDGCLSLFPTSTNYREGLRIHATSNWSDITLCGNDNTGDTGTSANSWLIGNNNGNFYISRNGSSSGTSWLGCVGNVWKLYGNQTNSKSKQQSILHIYGPTYGNTAADMISGTAGLFSWGDGGPQITFDTSATPGGSQAGALIFTDHDTAATGASFHFVSNQSDWNVTSKRFHARTSISIGSNLPNTSYNLYVNGTSTMTNTLTLSGGSVNVQQGHVWAGTNGNTSGERQVGVQSGSGQLYMYAQAATSANRGIYIPAHGSGAAKSVVNVDTNNRIYFADSYNGSGTALAYSQAGLAASAITWLTCWNGYELRAISKAEVANAVKGAASGSWGISVTGSSASCTGNAATASTASALSYSGANFNFGGAAGGVCKKFGQIVLCTIQCQTSSAIAANAVGGTIPSGYRPSMAHYYQGINGSTWIHFGFYTDGTIKPVSQIPSGAYIRLDCVYQVA